MLVDFDTKMMAALKTHNSRSLDHAENLAFSECRNQ